MQSLNPENEDDWLAIAEEACFRPMSIPVEYGVPYSTFRAWITKRSVPRDRERVVRIMHSLAKHPKMKKHPSYGWATEEQIERLKTLGLGPTRDAILKQIQKQTKAKGKTK